jgi:hypothetical protein
MIKIYNKIRIYHATLEWDIAILSAMMFVATISVRLSTDFNAIGLCMEDKSVRECFCYYA